jgi:predicted amidohydrolase
MPTVAVPQMSVADLAVESNLAEIAGRLAGLPDRVDLACFPEYALTGFVADDRVRDAALPPDAPALNRLAALAESHETAVLAGYVERGEAGAHGYTTGSAGATKADDTAESESTDAADAADPPLYNAAVYVRPSGERRTYRKRHLWGGERDLLTPGEDRLVLDTPAGRTAILTCYDLNFVAESAALAEVGVDCLLVPGAWPATHSENWRLLLRARALDGVRWVVGAGRTGRRDLPDAHPVVYAGRSAVVRPDGAVSAALNRDDRDLVAELDPAVLAEQREFIPVLD